MGAGVVTPAASKPAAAPAPPSHSTPLLLHTLGGGSHAVPGKGEQSDGGVAAAVAAAAAAAGFVVGGSNGDFGAALAAAAYAGVIPGDAPFLSFTSDAAAVSTPASDNLLLSNLLRMQQLQIQEQQQHEQQQQREEDRAPLPRTRRRRKPSPSSTSPASRARRAAAASRSPKLPLMPADEAARPAALLGSGVEDYLGVFDGDVDADNENYDGNLASSFSSLPALPLGRGLAAPLLPRRARVEEEEEEEEREERKSNNALEKGRSLQASLPPGARALHRALLHAAQARAEGSRAETSCNDEPSHANSNSCSSPEVWRAALEAVVASGGPIA